MHFETSQADTLQVNFDAFNKCTLDGLSLLSISKVLSLL